MLDLLSFFVPGRKMFSNQTLAFSIYVAKTRSRLVLTVPDPAECETLRTMTLVNLMVSGQAIYYSVRERCRI